MAAAPARPARLILDANVLVAAAIVSARPSPTPLRVAVDRALAGEAVVFACPRLLEETERALRRPLMSRWIDVTDADVLAWIIGGSLLVADPDPIPPVCRDPADDYLVALARREGATIVTGDADLLALRDSGISVATPTEMAAALGISPST
jgi:putative PIN family toxin of toxin-antitoxin system